MDLELEKEEQKIFNTWGRDFSFPIATEYQERMKKAVLFELGISEIDLRGNPELKKGYLMKLNEWARGVVFGLKYELLKRNPPTDSKAQPSKTKRIGPEWSDWMRKLFNRRFNIVVFVEEHRKLDSKQIKWKRVTAEWNQSHPLDPLNPAQMARLYSRALTDEGITLQIEAMSTLEAIHKLADPQDLKDWQDGKLHLRIIKTSHFTVSNHTET